MKHRTRTAGIHHAVWSATCAAALAAGLLPAARTEGAAAISNLPPGLVAYFTFDEWETGGVIPDRSGHNLHGRVAGAKWTAAGRFNSGCEFGPSNTYFEVTNAPALAVTQATVALWFRAFKADAVSRYLAEKLPERGFALAIAGDAKEGGTRGKLRAVAGGQACLGSTTITDGSWHHAAATYDGQTLRLYVDGQIQQQTASWRGALLANDRPLTLGMNRSSPSPQEKGLSFEGVIDEALVFRRALTTNEVMTVLAATKPRFTKEQVARRLAELKELFDRGLLTPEFYARKVKECESGL